MPAPRSTREELLTRIVDIVLRRGWDVSTRDLAAEAYTSHRMLDYYFGNRDSLMGLVIERASARLMGVFEHSLPTPTAPLRVSALAELPADPLIAARWLELLARAALGEPAFVAAAQRIGAAWTRWVMSTFELDEGRAVRVLAAYEGAGVVALIHGPAAGATALIALLDSIDDTEGRP